MAKNRAVSTKAIPTPARKGGDGKAVGNLILLALPRQESTRLFPLLEFVRLNLHHVMHETGEVIKSAYFVNSGLGSVLTVLPSDSKPVPSEWWCKRTQRLTGWMCQLCGKSCPIVHN